MRAIPRVTVNDELPTLEMLPEDVLEGEPQVWSKFVEHTPGDQYRGFSGIFSATPGAVKTSQDATESIFVLEGDARVENADGQRADLGSGDLPVMPAGDWVWTFLSDFRAVFVRNAKGN